MPCGISMIAAIALSAGAASADEKFTIDGVDTIDTMDRFERFDRLETYSMDVTVDELGLDVSVGGKLESASLDVSFQIDEMGTITGVETATPRRGGRRP